MPVRSNATRCGWRCCDAPRAPTSTCSCRGRAGCDDASCAWGVPARDLPALGRGLPRRHRRRLPCGRRGRVPGRLDRRSRRCAAPLLVAWLALDQHRAICVLQVIVAARDLSVRAAVGEGARLVQGRPDADARRLPRDCRSGGTGHAGVDRGDRRPRPDLVRALRGARRAAAAAARVAAARTGVPVPRAHVSGSLPVSLRCPGTSTPEGAIVPGGVPA